MTDQNLPVLKRPTSSGTGLPILVTGNAMKMIPDPARPASYERAIEWAVKLSGDYDIKEPRTVWIPDCPLTVHAHPARGAVIIMSPFPGWPAVTDDLVEALLPFCSPMFFA